jgi:predicted transcriptional regulator
MTLPRHQPSVTPAVPINKAITQDKVFCLCCGKGFKMLKRHLGAEHDLTEAEYRTMFDLPEDLPLVAPSYSKKKANYAKKAGFGKYNRGSRPVANTGENVE